MFQLLYSRLELGLFNEVIGEPNQETGEAFCQYLQVSRNDHSTWEKRVRYPSANTTIGKNLARRARIHVVDGGFQSTGSTIVSHIKQHYGVDPYIDHVVVTHPDGDHAGGLRTVLEEMNVGALAITPLYKAESGEDHTP